MEHSRRGIIKRVLAVLAFIALALGLMPSMALANDDLQIYVRGSDHTVTYNGGTQSYEGFVEGVCASSDYDSHKFSYTGNKKVEGKDVGEYMLFLISSDCHYTGGTCLFYIAAPISLRITKATLTVSTGSASKEYDGTPLTNAEASIEGLQGGETATVTATGSQTVVGSSRNGYSIEWDTADEMNYEISQNLGTLEVKKNTKELAVASKDGSWTYDGDAHVKHSYIVTFGNETIEGAEGQLEFTLSTGDKLTVTPDGSASITDVTAQGVDNTFTWSIENENCYTKGTDVAGKLTMAPAKATIAVADASKVEGKADPAFTGTIEGLVAKGDLGTVSYKRTNTDEAPGVYKGVITATYTANPNYDVTVKNGDFTIKKKGIYESTSGSASTWAKGSTDPLTFTFKSAGDDGAMFDLFEGVEVDGKVVPEKDPSGNANWTAKKGSLILSLQPSFLETLADGDHTVKALFDDGESEASFTIAAKPAPAAGTASKPTSAANAASKPTSAENAASKPTSAKTGDALPLTAVVVAMLLSGVVLAVSRRKLQAMYSTKRDKHSR